MIQVITDNNNNAQINVNTPTQTNANVDVNTPSQVANMIEPTVLHGPKGEDGRGIVKIEKTSTSDLVDTYTITFTDNTTTTFTVTNGEKGDTGDTGETGNGIASIEKTSTSDLVDTYTITFTDDTTTTFTVTNGEKGDTGNTGATGNGIASISKTATSGLTDTYTITFTNGTTTTFDVVNGQDGVDGTDGTDGTDGQDGYSPTATVTQTSSGATVSITDKNGTTTANITNGTDGTNGQDGTDGIDGYSPTATVTQSGSVTTISITDKNGTTTESINLSDYVQGSDLSTVATTGDYDDLINKPIIDNALSTTSENPVQNKVITNALNNIDVDTLIPVTYSELVTLKTGGNLVEGAFYRITDYVTTSNGHTITTGEPSRSAGHAFDIIIQATGASNLAEIGTAALHSGDTYFANENLGAWQIWYDINNDTTKYYWADTTNGKGVIYRMIDEMNNDLPYDFKNIQFYRDGSATKYSAAASYLTASDGYYYTFSYNNNGTISDMSVAYSNFCSGNVISSGYAIGTGYALNNAFWIVTNSTHQICDNTFDSDFNNNIFYGLCFSNHFSAFCYGNIFANQTYGNTFGSNCYNNVISSSFYYNVIGCIFYNNIISNASGAFHSNIIGAKFYNNTISSARFSENTTGATFYSNTISGNFYLNSIGAYFRENTISANFFQNTTGVLIYGNKFSGATQYSDFGTALRFCTFNGAVAMLTTGAYCDSIIANGVLYYSSFGNFVTNIILPTNTNSVRIASRVNGSSSTNKLDLTGIPTGSTYEITITRDVNNGIVAKWNDGANETGLYKATVTTSSWSDLLPTYTWET